MKYKVWECKIVVAENAVLPDGFDHSPRRAAIEAVEKHTGVVTCFSGWGGTLTECELECINRDYPDMDKG